MLLIHVGDGTQMTNTCIKTIGHVSSSRTIRISISKVFATWWFRTNVPGDNRLVHIRT